MNDKTITFELPWPPSTNHYLRHFILPGRKAPSTCISADGRAFLCKVGWTLLKLRIPKIVGELAMNIDLYPPNRRRIDVDNRAKPILDSLKRRPKDKDQIRGCWLFADDDSQVTVLRIAKRQVVPGGKAVVTVVPLQGPGSQMPLFERSET